MLGASADKIELNRQFTDKNEYSFPLLSDPDLKLIQALGIQSPKGKLSQRLTFVVDADGKIAKIYDKVTPKDHPKEVLAFVKELGKK